MRRRLTIVFVNADEPQETWNDGLNAQMSVSKCTCWRASRRSWGPHQSSETAYRTYLHGNSPNKSPRKAPTVCVGPFSVREYSGTGGRAFRDGLGSSPWIKICYHERYLRFYSNVIPGWTKSQVYGGIFDRVNINQSIFLYIYCI